MEISVTEFKAKCLALIEQVNTTGQPLTITKRGKWIAELRPKHKEPVHPREQLQGTLLNFDDPFQPSVTDSDIEDRL
mgnify:CR=1 FL=1